MLQILKIYVTFINIRVEIIKHIVYSIIKGGTMPDKLTTAQQIKMALMLKGLKESNLAELMGTSAQNLNQLLKRDNFTQATLEKIAKVLDINYVSYFEFPDGRKTI